MALPSRICLLALCLLLVPVAGAPGETSEPAPRLRTPALVRDPARLPGSVPLVPRPTPTRRAPSLGQQAVRIASSELGAPYRYGGSGPGGFDCSGLVAYVYGRLGIALPHNAAAQYGYGRPVDSRHLRPGDLVFFHGLGHVGLYIGHGRMIHAPQTGERVEIQSLSVRSGSIEGARRIMS
jgi:cell wall-associated NlpC family hydrolase